MRIRQCLLPLILRSTSRPFHMPLLSLDSHKQLAWAQPSTQQWYQQLQFKNLASPSPMSHNLSHPAKKQASEWATIPSTVTSFLEILLSIPGHPTTNSVTFPSNSERAPQIRLLTGHSFTQSIHSFYYSISSSDAPLYFLEAFSFIFYHH